MADQLLKEGSYKQDPAKDMCPFELLLVELLDIKRPPLHELAVMGAKRILEWPLPEGPLSAEWQGPTEGPRIMPRYAASLLVPSSQESYSQQVGFSYHLLPCCVFV